MSRRTLLRTLARTVLALLGLAGSTSAQLIVYVDDSAVGAGDGTSWTDAFSDLQAALAATPAGEFWVAEGVYYPAPAGSPETAFELRSDVALYGGFDGSESARDQRDPVAHPTTLSGDIDQNDTYGSGWNWWQFNWTGQGGNSHNIVRANGVDATAVLDGFTLIAGTAGGTYPSGAGMHLTGASPTLANLVFEKNAWGVGSALYATASDVTVRNSVVRDGYSFGQGPSGFAFLDGSQALIEDCLFENHYMVATMGQGRGGAMYVDLSSTATVRRSRFDQCQTGNWFAVGDPQGAYGAGIHNRGDDLLVEHCIFENGFSHAGSGIYTARDTTVIGSLFRHNRVVSYPVEVWLDYGDFGAGIGTTGSGELRVEGCTFAENEGDKGALACGSVTTAIVRNTILWGNYGHPPEPGEDSIWPLKHQITGQYDLGWSSVDHLLQTEPGEDPPEPDNYPGCIEADPLFAMDGFDFSLAPGSPCIDAGSNVDVTPGVATDLTGSPRFEDDPAVVDTGLGSAPLVDMGAYEFDGLSPLLVADAGELSLSFGGTQNMSLSTGPAHAGANYLVLGSNTGTSPGFVYGGVPIPLNPLGPYFVDTIVNANGSMHPQTFGSLDSNGRAAASFVLPTGLNPGLAGLVLDHAFLAFELPGVASVAAASNPVSLLLQP